MRKKIITFRIIGMILLPFGTIWAFARGVGAFDKSWMATVDALGGGSRIIWIEFYIAIAVAILGLALLIIGFRKKS